MNSVFCVAPCRATSLSKIRSNPIWSQSYNRGLWPFYTDSDFDSVGCDSHIQHRTKIGLFLSLDAAVASDTVKITVRLNRPLQRHG
jgi:hypothetical protein